MRFLRLPKLVLIVLGASAAALLLCLAVVAGVLVGLRAEPPAAALETPASLPTGVLFQDDFSSEEESRSKGWLIAPSDKGDVLWSPNKLTLAVKQKDYGQYDWPNATFKDYGVEIEAEPSNEPGNIYARYGILFGIANESASELYDFGVTTGGEYSLSKVADGHMVLPILVDFTPSACLKPRPTKNRLGVLVEGSKISLYINGSLVKTVTDDTIKSGHVGISVDSLFSERAAVTFSRITVLTAEKAKADWGAGAACAPAPPVNGILFNDDFASELASWDKGWGFDTSDERESRWSAGKYTIDVKQKGLREVARPVGVFDNFGVEVEAEPDPSSSLEYGIAFRYNEGGDVPDDYVFGLVVRSKDESYYYMGKEIGGRLAQPTLVPVRLSSRIQPGWAKNRLGVLADGSTISLYINGALVKTITDRSIGSGQVGVFVGTLDSARAQASFGRMTVYTADKAKELWGTPPPPTPGVLYQADFNSEQALGDDGWQVGANNAADNLWSPGKMSMSVKVKHYLYTSGPNYDRFGDFGVEVEAQPEDDPAFSYGLLFRESRLGRDKPSYYIFAVTSSGFYMLRRQSEGVFADPDPVDLTPSPLILKGASKNRIGVLAEGSNVSLYLNGKWVKTIYGDAPLSGKVEVFVLSGSKERTQVDFTGMTIYTVEEAKRRWGGTTALAPEPTRVPGVIFDDDFSSNSKSIELGWNFGSLGTGDHIWSPNKFTTIVKGKKTMDFGVVGGTYDNFGIEIEAQPEDKPGIQYGIVFRVKPDSARNEDYVFVLTAEGEYSLMTFLDGKVSERDSIILSPSPFIQRGPAKNRLGVLADGGTIALYINGNLVNVLRGPLLAGGSLGLVAYSGDNDQAQVTFSHVTVYTVDRAKEKWGTPQAPLAASGPDILFQDDFSSKTISEALGWTFGSFEGRARTWTPNAMVVALKPRTTDAALAGRIFTDFGIEVEAQADQPTGVVYGIAFRFSQRDNRESLYIFNVTPDGAYNLVKEVDGKLADDNVVPPTPSPYIKAGLSKNRLGVLAEGSTISLYINGYLVNTVTDNSLSSGLEGTFSSSGDSSETKVSFSRVTVYSVERAKVELGKK